MIVWNIYYDGLCQLCSREMEHYQKLNGSEKFGFIDITSQNFNPLEQGLDPVAVHKVMHIKSTLTGEIKTGVDAFIEIWRVLPSYRWASRVASWPLVKALFKVFYALFARYRGYLPKRKLNCDESPYCENLKRK